MPTGKSATFHTGKPVTLEDGEHVVVYPEGDELVVRRVPRFDSGEPIIGTEAFIASAKEFTARVQRER